MVDQCQAPETRLKDEKDRRVKNMEMNMAYLLVAFYVCLIISQYEKDIYIGT